MKYFCQVVPEESDLVITGHEKAAGIVPDCPILYTSCSSMFLLQGADIFHVKKPLIGFYEPLYEVPILYQTVPWLTMHAQIPNIGVVIVGGQDGHVGVFTLTHLAEDEVLGVKYGTRELCAMRLDHTLPFASQQRACERPASQLIGIAVAPMQGINVHERQMSRWRLVLTYRNCRLLSYEISRSDESGEVDNLIL